MIDGSVSGILRSRYRVRYYLNGSKDYGWRGVLGAHVMRPALKLAV